MGFFGDLATVVSRVSPATALWKDSIDQKNAGRQVDPGPNRAHTFIQRDATNAGAGDLANRIYHTDEARKYGNVFDQGYQSLSQPLRDNNRDDVYVGGTRSLASAFADRVFQQTGYLPTEDQVRQFVAQNLTPTFAQKFILGIPPDQINTIADEYIKGNPDALINPGVQGAQKSAEEQRLMSLTQQLDKIYNAGRENLVSGYDDTVYGPGKARVANDLAGQGMLTQPNSRYALGELEANRGRDLRSGLNQLEGERAAGTIDLSKAIEGLLQQNKDRAQNAYQFGKTFNAGRDDAFFNQGLQTRGLDLASQIGKAQADASKKTWMDYLNTGLNVGSTLAMTKMAFK